MKNFLAADRQTDYRIIHASNADPATRHAAEELSQFLHEITGARFPIFDESTPRSEKELIVGKSGRSDGLDLDWSLCGQEGYFVKTLGDSLLMAGNTGRSNLYAVYDLLEEAFGCRWFTPEVSKIPKRDALALPALDRQITPVLEYRRAYSDEARDMNWAARNRQNGLGGPDEKRGGEVIYAGWVHTFEYFLPSSVYFDDHPEYFAEIDGKRRKRGDGVNETQPCLTNPDVLSIVTKNVLDLLAKTPGATITSISQNDLDTPCQCANCRKVDQDEGSYAGTLLRFVNAVAEEVEKHYPHVSVDTLAYSYTRRAPKITKPRHNVIIRLCSIECCFTHPFGTCPDVIPSIHKDQLSSLGNFAEDLAEWSKICDHIYIWDYLLDFFYILMPYPNVEVIQPNIRFLIKNNVKGIFIESYSLGSYAAELKNYLAARCLWNPDCDAEKVIDEFLVAVYGQASHVMKQIFGAYRKEVVEDDIHLYFNISIFKVYNRPGFLESLEPMYDEAERLADDEATLRQVKKARLWHRFTVIIKSKDHLNPVIQANMDALVTDCASYGISHFDPYSTMEAWAERWKRVGVTE